MGVAMLVIGIVLIFTGHAMLGVSLLLCLFLLGVKL